MRALSIIGIVMSVIGLITCIYVMTEAKCHCYCDDDYLYSSSSVPGDAIGGSMVNMLIFIFFLVMSIVGTSKSYSNQPHLAQHIPPFQANPYSNYQQPYQQPYSQQNPYQQTQQPNPYQQNPYQQNPYQQPTQNPQQPNPYQPPQKNPYENPEQNQTPPANPWEPK